MSEELTAYIKRVWTQMYRGISIEIQHWGAPEKPEYYEEEGLRGTPKGMCEGKGCWNYYLYLPEDAFSPEQFSAMWLAPEEYEFAGKKRTRYHYECYPFSELDFPGGATFYQKHGGFDGLPRSVQIGCDYAHSWDRDRGYPYDQKWLWMDAKRSVDLLHGLYPDMKRRSAYDGNYYLQSDLVEYRPGVWYTRQNIQESEAWDAKWKQDKEHA